MSDSEMPQECAADQPVPTTETTVGVPEVDIERQKQIEEYDRAAEQELRMPIIDRANVIDRQSGGYGSIVSLTRTFTDGSITTIGFRKVAVLGYYSDEQI